MKTAAAMTSRVMESVCALPGVAVLDWCDRAAQSVTGLFRPSAAAVYVGQLDARATLTTLECVGAAAVPATDAPAPARDPRGVDPAAAARESLREGEWIGWTSPGPESGGSLVDVIKPAAAGPRLADAPLLQRWEGLNPSDVLVGAVGLPGPAGRTMLVELAMVNATPTDVQRVLAVMNAILPLLGVRYVNAIGAEPADRHRWLTPREELILWKLVSGKKVPQIAQDLHRSIYTVHDHVKALHRKLGATNRGQLVARALGHLGPLITKAGAHRGDDEGGLNHAELHHPAEPRAAANGSPAAGAALGNATVNGKAR